MQRNALSLTAVTLFFLYFSTLPVAAQAVKEKRTLIGRITGITGAVDLVSMNSGKRREAELGDAVYADEQIRTSRNAFARIALFDSSRLEIRSVSVVNIRRLRAIEGIEKKYWPVSVRMLSGKIRMKVRTSRYYRKKFYVKTPTLIASVKGTDFACIATRSTARLAVFEGSVQVGNRSRDYQTAYLLKARQEVTVPANAEPHNLRYLPPEILNNYLDHYEINREQKIKRRIREPVTFIDALLLEDR